MKSNTKTKRPRIVESRAKRLSRAVLAYSTTQCKTVNDRLITQ